MGGPCASAAVLPALFTSQSSDIFKYTGMQPATGLAPPHMALLAPTRQLTTSTSPGALAGQLGASLCCTCTACKPPSDCRPVRAHLMDPMADRTARLDKDRAKFDDALLEVQLMQQELRHRQDIETEDAAEPAVPALTPDQRLLAEHQQRSSMQGDSSSSPEAVGSKQDFQQRARLELDQRFEDGGTQLIGDTDIVCHRSTAEGAPLPQDEAAGRGAGGELPPLSMLRGVPQGLEAGTDWQYVRSVTAAEQDWASEEGDAA